MSDVIELQRQLAALRTTVESQAHALAQAQNNDNVAALQAQIVALQGQLTNQAEAIGNLPAQGGISRAIRLEPFKPHAQGHSWTAYKVKLRSVFNRAQITTDRQKKEAFFEVMPVEYIDWLTNHFHPQDVKADAVTFDDVISVFDGRFGVKESKRYAALKFHMRKFNQGEETIDEWVMDLERWASKCAFGTYLDTAIVNQLVIGIPDVQLQLDLTDNDTLTKAQVLARIKHWDQTLREAASFQTALPAAAASSLNPSPVLAVSSSSFGPPRAKKNSTIPGPKRDLFCASCGGKHDRQWCKHRQAVCYSCNKTGHLAVVCQSLPGSASPADRSAVAGSAATHAGARGPSSPPAGPVNSNTGSRPSTSDAHGSAGRAAPVCNAFVYPILMIRPPTQVGSLTFFEPSKPYVLSVVVDSVPVKFIVDTGSAYTLLNDTDFRRLWPART